jgi:membrane associated rhomboid family serine protease
MALYDRGYYHDSSNLDMRPDWNQRSAVTTLLIINVAVFVANMLFGKPTPQYQGTINEWLMLYPQDAVHPWMWWRALSYAFVHNSTAITHLAFNMLSLYFMGRAVEQRYGRAEFFRIYLAAALFCGAVWLLMRLLTGGASPVLGASGAVLCISMLFVFNYPQATVYFLVFPMPAWVLGVIFVLTNLLMQPGSNIANDVHLFGILFATLYFFLGWNFVALNTPVDMLRRWGRWLTRPRLKVHSGGEDTREDRDAAEADRLLAKIHESGKDSLTAREKKFLEKYSQTVRNRKRMDS